jgi:hypothetical protein
MPVNTLSAESTCRCVCPIFRLFGVPVGCAVALSRVPSDLEQSTVTSGTNRNQQASTYQHYGWHRSDALCFEVHSGALCKRNRAQWSTLRACGACARNTAHNVTNNAATNRPTTGCSVLASALPCAMLLRLIPCARLRHCASSPPCSAERQGRRQLRQISSDFRADYTSRCTSTGSDEGACPRRAWCVCGVVRCSFGSVEVLVLVVSHEISSLGAARSLVQFLCSSVCVSCRGRGVGEGGLCPLLCVG